MTSQPVIFRAFFSFSFSVPPQLIKKSGLNCLYLFQIHYETFPARTWHTHQEEEDRPRDRPQDCPPVIFARRRLHQSPALLLT